jgi:CheY-like chemotaxis protein
LIREIGNVLVSTENREMNCVQKTENPQFGTVLIVDDTVDDLRFAKGVIAAACPQLCIRGVGSGPELIAYLKGENTFSNRTDYPYPRLILLDLKMPEMHGFEVLRWLRKHPPHNLIPVVVLTASGEMLVARNSYDLGARSFLTKPIQAGEFKETLVKFQEWIKQTPPAGCD